MIPIVLGGATNWLRPPYEREIAVLLYAIAAFYALWWLWTWHPLKKTLRRWKEWQRQVLLFVSSAVVLALVVRALLTSPALVPEGQQVPDVVSTFPISEDFGTTIFWSRGSKDLAHCSRGGLAKEMGSLDMMRAFGQLKDAHLASVSGTLFHGSSALLEYVVIKELAARFRDRWSVALVDAPAGGGTSISFISRPLRSVETHSHLRWEDLARYSEVNPYFRIPGEIQVAVPSGSAVDVRLDSNGSGAIVIGKSEVFDLSITFTPGPGGGDALGFNPTAFGLTEDQARNVYSYPVWVGCVFSAGREFGADPDALYYRIWATEMFGALRRKFADPG